MKTTRKPAHVRALEAGATVLLPDTPKREQRVNVDFPLDLLRRIDAEAERLGVSRQSFLKIRIADSLPAEVK